MISTQVPSVLIYQDYVHNNGLLWRALTGQYGRERVSYCDSEDILSGCLTPDIRLLVMPGGADLYYCEKLNGPGNAAIRAWVEAGGIYFGICAGAYYACRTLIWAESNPDMRINGPRELAFFPGTATGPVPDFIENGDPRKSWMGVPMLRYEAGGEIIETPVWYEAGPLFVPDDPEFFAKPDCTILARYQNLPGQPPAILQIRIGKGQAILCSPHVERVIDDPARTIYRLWNKSLTYEYEVSRHLEDSYTERHALWTVLLDHIFQG